MSHFTSSSGGDASPTTSGQAPDATANRAARRTLFRALGVVCMGTALVLIGIAVADFFQAFSSPSSPGFGLGFDEGFDEGPTKFWLFFVAVPFFAVGGFFLNLGFSGATATYMAGEYSPAIQSVARDLGMRSDAAPGATPGVPAAGPYCRSCGTRNDQDARFCDSCGSSMSA